MQTIGPCFEVKSGSFELANRVVQMHHSVTVRKLMLDHTGDLHRSLLVL
jgi:hypothetical protein